MISKLLSKLKSILFKSAVSSEAPLKKEKKLTKSVKSSKTKTKEKKVNAKNILSLTKLPGVGAKSANALYKAGFKTTKAVIEADEKDLLAVSGVGINLVKKLINLK